MEASMPFTVVPSRTIAPTKWHEAFELRNAVSYHCHSSETEHEVRMRIYCITQRDVGISELNCRLQIQSVLVLCSSKVTELSDRNCSVVKTAIQFLEGLGPSTSIHQSAIQ